MSKKVDLSRRDFMKAAALITGAGFLGGCAPNIIETPVVGEQPSGETGAIDWLGTEPEITDISETVESDVIVIGAGTAGAYIASSCLEKGLTVAILEKRAVVSTLRNDWGAVDSKWQLEEEAVLPKDAIFHYHQIYSAGRLDQRLPRIWLKESGAAINWIGELLESRGARFYYEGGYEPDFSPATYPKFPTGHSGDFDEGVSGASIMRGYIEELGGKYYFETPFVKFEHEGKKVTAAIAQNKEGKYLRFIGKKGIVLCTGGYQGNRDMMKALVPYDTMIMGPMVLGDSDVPPAGDGIKACLWMGAEMDEVHKTMIFDRMGLLPTETPATVTMPIYFHWGSQPWLKVNLKGERFLNESGPYEFPLHAAAKQPGRCYACLFDSDYFNQILQFETMGCSRIHPFPNGSPNDGTGTDLAVIKTRAEEDLQNWIKSGHVQQADTWEELATKLNIPSDTMAATVKRYNELAEKGEDEDFFKDAYRLLPLKAPPYYGVRTCGFSLSTLDGIRIDTQMRPVDSENEPFEGLHVVGDSSGSYFAHTYPNLFTGDAHGRTITFCRRVARILAGESVDLPAA